MLRLVVLVACLACILNETGSVPTINGNTEILANEHLAKEQSVKDVGDKGDNEILKPLAYGGSNYGNNGAGYVPKAYGYQGDSYRNDVYERPSVEYDYEPRYASNGQYGNEGNGRQYGDVKYVSQTEGQYGNNKYPTQYSNKYPGPKGPKGEKGEKGLSTNTVYCVSEKDFVLETGQFVGLNSFIYYFNGCLLVSSELIYDVNINHVNGGTGDTSKPNATIYWQTGMSILTFDCENITPVMITTSMKGEYIPNGANFPYLTLAQKQQCHNFQCDLNSNNVLQSCNLHPTTELQTSISLPNQPINRYIVIGCFRDFRDNDTPDVSQRDLIDPQDRPSGPFNYASWELCTTQCRSQGYRYAGLQFG
jgi:hypothetical protein